MGNSDDPHLEDVDIQFHASCVYMCNSLCWGLTKAKLGKEYNETFFLKANDDSDWYVIVTLCKC